MSKVISRKTWGADDPHRARARPSKYDGVEVHHSVSPTIAQVTGYTQVQEAAVVRGLQEWMMRSKAKGGKGWNDLFYNRITFPSGREYEGRADTPNGMFRDCFIGNFMVESPTQAQQNALVATVQEFPGKIDTHRWRAVGTKYVSLCPGDNMIEFVNSVLEGEVTMDNPEHFIGRLYVAFFDRQPDTVGKNFWLSQIREGWSEVRVLIEFIALDRQARDAARAALAARVGGNEAQIASNSYEEHLDKARQALEDVVAGWSTSTS